MVLGVILAVAWAVVILAALLRWRDERRLGDTVVDFHRQLRVLRRSASRRHERLLARSERQSPRVATSSPRARTAALAFSTFEPGETARTRLDRGAEGRTASWVFPDEQVAGGESARRPGEVARAASRGFNVDAPAARGGLAERADADPVSPGSIDAGVSVRPRGEQAAARAGTRPGTARRASRSGGRGVPRESGAQQARPRPAAGRSRREVPTPRAAAQAGRRTLRHRRGRMLVVFAVSTLGSLLAGVSGPRWVFALAAAFSILTVGYVVLLRKLRPARATAVGDRRRTTHRARPPHELGGSVDGIRVPAPQRIPIEGEPDVLARSPVAHGARR